MDWIDRLNEAVRYIEDNLTGEIEYEKLGQIACCSAYHFHRMFNYIAACPCPSISAGGRCRLRRWTYRAGRRR